MQVSTLKVQYLCRVVFLQFIISRVVFLKLQYLCQEVVLKFSPCFGWKQTMLLREMIFAKTFKEDRGANTEIVIFKRKIERERRKLLRVFIN